MMPPGHVISAWGITRLLQSTNPHLAQLDYRLMAISTMLPDLIDKPLAILAFPEAHTSQLIAHSLLFNVVILVLTLLLLPRFLPYALAFNGHLLADRVWYHTKTFWWPLYGWDVFFRYKPMDTPQAMFNVYVDIIINYPHVWLVEIFTFIILLWMIYQQRWYAWPTLKRFVMTGRVDVAQSLDCVR
jgi:hypothetical protein